MSNYTSTPSTFPAGSNITAAKLADWAALLTAETDTWSSYTPTWTGTGSNPAIGNGTLAGEYKQIGKTVFYRGIMVAGSSTTFGSGTWELSWPVTPTSTANTIGGYVGAAFVLDNSATAHWAAAIISITTSTLRIAVTNAASSGYLTPTAPMTWSTSDRFSWHITYQAP